MHNGTGPAFARFTAIANLSPAVPGVDHLTASLEFTPVVDADRLTPGTDTVETALACPTTPTTRPDLVGFVGFDRAAPEFQVAAGVAHRFGSRPGVDGYGFPTPLAFSDRPAKSVALDPSPGALEQARTFELAYTGGGMTWASADPMAERWTA